MVYLVDENGKSVNDVCFKNYLDADDFLFNIRKCGISNWYLDYGKLNNCLLYTSPSPRDS